LQVSKFPRLQYQKRRNLAGYHRGDDICPCITRGLLTHTLSLSHTFIHSVLSLSLSLPPFLSLSLSLSLSYTHSLSQLLLLLAEYFRVALKCPSPAVSPVGDIHFSVALIALYARLTPLILCTSGRRAKLPSRISEFHVEIYRLPFSAPFFHRYYVHILIVRIKILHNLSVLILLFFNGIQLKEIFNIYQKY